MMNFAVSEKAEYVNRMFAAIAPRYDLLNRLMTGGRDVAWRQEVIALCELPPKGRMLDVGTGTGDIAYEARRIHAGVEAVGCDFTFEMMAVGQNKVSTLVTSTTQATAVTETLEFVQADGLHLPFADDYFDAVTSGFLLRNVADLDMALAEQRRVTKPGGRMVCLETSPPPQTMLAPLVRFYMFRIIPLLGWLLSSRSSAYRYLPQSTVVFPRPEELAWHMERVGFRHVFYRRKMLGTIAIHVGVA